MFMKMFFHYIMFRVSFNVMCWLCLHMALGVHLVYQLADVKVFGIEGASGHDVVAVPACAVEGVPEHDVLLDRECICHRTVVVATT